MQDNVVLQDLTPLFLHCSCTVLDPTVFNRRAGVPDLCPLLDRRIDVAIAVRMALSLAVV